MRAGESTWETLSVIITRVSKGGSKYGSRGREILGGFYLSLSTMEGLRIWIKITLWGGNLP